MTNDNKPPMVFLDEFGYYFGGSNDSLKEDLRKIDGVPNATYLVKDRQVFVFDKLVQLVNEHRKRQSDLPLSDLARSLIEEATVSTKEAVETWGVVPEPYEMAENPESGLMIRHRPFNARLPGTFCSARSQDASTNRTRPKMSGNGLPIPCCAEIRWTRRLPLVGQRTCTTAPSPYWLEGSRMPCGSWLTIRNRRNCMAEPLRP